MLLLQLLQLLLLSLCTGRILRDSLSCPSYIEDLLHRQQVTPPKGRTTYIIKDVRLFLNSVDRGLHLMRQAGVNADWGRQDTDEEILLTIRIPKRVRT